MLKFTGKGVYGAVAIGYVSIFERRGCQAERLTVTDTEAELKRLNAAKETAKEQLEDSGCYRPRSRVFENGKKR